jgi:hypothetical protein
MYWSRRFFLKYFAAAGIGGISALALSGCGRRFLDEAILHAPAQGDARPPKRPARFVLRDDLEGLGGQVGPQSRRLIALGKLSDVHITLEGFSLTGHPALEKLLDQFGDSIGFGGLDRPEIMERFDVDVLRAVVKTFNAAAEDLDLVVNTGDSIDIGTVRELVAFLTEMNHLNIPWFQTVGNHDRLALGNIPPRLVESYSGMDFLDKNAFVEKHFPTGKDIPGTTYGSRAKGFDFSPRSVVDQRVRLGYYSFTAVPPVHGGLAGGGTRPGIRFFVLDTSRSEGSASGQISDEQLGWLQGQLDALKNYLAIVVSHHPIPQIKENRDKLVACLHSQPRVIALLCGHDHEHRIRPYRSKQGTGFWQIQTSSLIDFPQQARILEVYLNPEGGGVIRTFVFNQEAGGSLGENARASYAAASKEKFSGTGKEEDRNADLLFSISRRMG